MQILKDDEWLRFSEEFTKFEGTAKDFCKAHGVNDKTFYSRRQKCSDLTKIITCI